MSTVLYITMLTLSYFSVKTVEIDGSHSNPAEPSFQAFKFFEVVSLKDKQNFMYILRQFHLF